MPSFVKVWSADNPREQLEFTYSTDANEITLHLREKQTESLHFLVAEATAAFEDGVVVFSALDARVIGKQAKLESHPGNHRIGFWSEASDYVSWDFAVPADTYETELVYSRATPSGTQVKVAIGNKQFQLKLETTGSWYRYRTIPLGPLTIKADGKTHVEVRVDKIVNGGVMNLKAIFLTPKKSAAKKLTGKIKKTGDIER